MTFLEHIYAIKHILNQGSAPKEVRTRDNIIAHFLDVSRAKLIKQMLDKHHTLPDDAWQHICVELQYKDDIQCPCIDDMPTCKVMIGPAPIPTSLATSDDVMIRLEDLGGNQISRTTRKTNKYNKFSLTNKDRPTYEVKNGLVYLYNTEKMDRVVGKILSTKPANVEAYNKCGLLDSSLCKTYDFHYPIPASLVDPMYKMTLESLAYAKRFPSDQFNNAIEDNTSGQNKK